VLYTVFIGLSAFFALYTGLRLIKPSRLGFWARTVAWCCLCYAWGSIPAEGFLRHAGVESRTIDVIAFGGAVAFGVASLLLVLLLSRDSLLLLWHARRVLPRRRPRPLHDASRRQFIQGASGTGVMALAGVFSGTAMYGAMRVPAVRDIQMPVHGLHPALDGYTVVQLSDLHVGAFLGVDWLEGVVERANAAGADLIAVTGDIVDGSPRHLREQIEPLRRLQAPDGVFGVSGNHEYYSGISRWLPVLESLGLNMLENRSVRIRRGEASLLLGGVSDYAAHRFGRQYASDSRKAMLHGEDTDFKLLLAHQPASVFAAEKAGWNAMLCGHTHGGQVFPFMAVVSMVQPYLAGLYRHGAMQLYVSRGTGFWGPPFRLGAPAEISRVILRRA
jgi:hypothetical protein